MGKPMMFFVPGLMMIVTLLGIGLAVLGVSRLRNVGNSPDPFAAYAAMMPGQPSATLSRYPCHFETRLESNLESALCRIRPDDGLFSEVIVQVHGDRIGEVEFQPKTMRIGDLVMLWGSPYVHKYNGGVVYVTWHRGAIHTVISPDGQTRRFSYELPVYSIIRTEDER